MVNRTSKPTLNWNLWNLHTSVYVAVSFNSKRLVQIWNATSGEIQCNHYTKKTPASCLTFMTPEMLHERASASLLAYTEYRDIFIFDWKKKQVIQKLEIHRNVVLTLSFLSFRINQKHCGISIGFDNSIKLWEIDENGYQVLDKLHSSIRQHYTAFCMIRTTSTSVSNIIILRTIITQGWQMLLAQDKGIFKLVKIRTDGSFHLLDTINIDVLK